MKHAQTSPRKTGRPLSFDRDAALQQAMLTFWRYGYETSSIVDLTSAMGITTPSLYAAFGDKKKLFLEAMCLYAGDIDAIIHAMDTAPTAHDFARDMLKRAAITYSGNVTPKGCLLASATASGSSASADVQRAVAKIRHTIESHLRTRIKRDIENGLLPTATDAAGLSGLVMAVAQGMSVLARDGASRATLMTIITTALRAWP